MSYRIYVDESGTHDDAWLIIGMLFVPDSQSLQKELIKAKRFHSYVNQSPKQKSYYKEIHFTKFRSFRDVTVGKKWIDAFVQHNCFYRAIVVDWSHYDGNYFGDPHEPRALKERRAYKKWAEMLLHPELKNPSGGGEIRLAHLYLDRLRLMYGYDVIEELKDRFTAGYEGQQPFIEHFEHIDSAADASQCLQLCDLLTGCLYQSLKPGVKRAKLETRDYLASSLNTFGVRKFEPSFWKGFNEKTLRYRLPKYSAWFWEPTRGRSQRRRKTRRSGRQRR